MVQMLKKVEFNFMVSIFNCSEKNGSFINQHFVWIWFLVVVFWYGARLNLVLVRFTTIIAGMVMAQWTRGFRSSDWMQHFRIRPKGPCRLSPLISKLAMAKVLSNSHILKMVIWSLKMVKNFIVRLLLRLEIVKTDDRYSEMVLAWFNKSFYRAGVV